MPAPRRQLRVLLATGLTQWGRGGVQRETARLVDGLVREGVAVALASDRPVDSDPPIPHFSLCYPPGRHAWLQVRAAAEAFRPDVVHAVGGGVSFLRAVERATSLPLVATIHCVPPFERTSRWFLGHNRLYRLVRDAQALPSSRRWTSYLRASSTDAFIVHSPTIWSQVASRGVALGRIVQIPLGCDPPGAAPDASPFPPDASPRLLVVGAYAHHKGLHDALRAVAGLVGSHPKLHLLIMGERREPAYASYLRRLVRRLRLGEHCTLREDVGEPERAAALWHADVYLQPSHEEGFCLTFAEAAMIVPRLLATRTGAIPALASHHHAARVVEPADPRGLASALAEVLAQPASDRPSPGGIGSAFAWEHHARAHADLYECLARLANPASRAA